MKTAVPALFLLPVISLAQPVFSENIIDSSTAAIGSSSMVTGDFNNDGFTDLAPPTVLVMK